jgi:hypothetical protein
MIIPMTNPKMKYMNFEGPDYYNNGTPCGSSYLWSTIVLLERR